MNIPLYLAPMDDVTDRAFRILCKENGADMVYSEFVAAESLIRNVDRSIKKISFGEEERPIGIQIFGNDIESMKKAANIAEEYNPDEININCGCPVRKIIRKGAGSALLKNVDNLVYMINEIKKVTRIPITVKTRLGCDEKSIIIDELVLKLQDIGVKKIIIHARTSSQMYSGNVNLEYLKRIKENSEIDIDIIGNGDVKDIASFENMKKTGVDGIMIGRASIGNPWIFNELKMKYKSTHNISEIVDMIKKHLALANKYNGEKYAILSLRKHYSGYFRNIPNVKKTKMMLMNFNTIDDINIYLDKLKNEI